MKRTLAYVPPDEYDAGQADVYASGRLPTLEFFCASEVPRPARLLSAYLCALLERTRQFVLRDVSLDQCRQCATVHARLRRFTLLHRAALSADQRALLFCVRAHCAWGARRADADTRVSRQMVYGGTVATAGAQLDMCHDALAAWHVLPSGSTRLHQLGALELWDATLSLLRSWPLQTHTAALECAVRYVEQCWARYIVYDGYADQFNHPVLCEAAADGLLQLSERAVGEIECAVTNMDAALAQCGALRLSPSMPSPRYALDTDSVRRGAEALRVELERVLCGPFSTDIREEFEQRLFDTQLLPGEMERFQTVHPDEEHTSRQCVVRMRRADYDVLATRWLGIDLRDAWRRAAENPASPVYMTLAVLALDALFAERFDNASFSDSYLFAVESLPMAQHCESPLAERRWDSLLWARDVNCGSFTYIFDLRHTQGLALRRRAALHADYRHPLLLRVLNGYVLALDGGHLVHFDTFVAAFLHWLARMCEDANVRGMLCNEQSLLPLYEAVLPERARVHAARARDDLNALRRNVARRFVHG